MVVQRGECFENLVDGYEFVRAGQFSQRWVRGNAGGVRCPLGHPRQRRPHLPSHAQDHQVALQPAERLNDAGRRLAEQVVELFLGLKNVSQFLRLEQEQGLVAGVLLEYQRINGF